MRELTSTRMETFSPAVVREVRKHDHIASLKPHKGHTFFELNTKTGSIQPAEIKETNCTITGGIIKSVITKPDCIYACALNIENAQKKLFKHIKTGK